MFKDIDGHWAENDINMVIEKELMKGYPDRTFKPDSPLTRAEMATILSRLVDDAEKKVENFTLIIDPGHRVDTPGKRANGFREYEFNDDVAKRLGAILKPYMDIQYTIITENHPYTEMTSEGRRKNLQYRCDVANAIEGRSLFVSIHANAADDPSASGYGIFVFSKAEERYGLAKSVQKAAKDILGVGTEIKNRGIKEAQFYVLKYTRMPAILIEHEFYTNPEVVKLLNEDDFRQKCAEHIAQGVLSHLENFNF